MLIGYARTSTAEQVAGLEAQERDLAAAGCEKVFLEQVSSVDRDRRLKLAEAVEFARAGDVLVVTKLDRLARSVKHLLEIVETLAAKGVALRILAMGIDTGSPTGRLMLQVLASVAEFERAIMLERQREGIAKAKRDGRYRGRKPVAERKAEELRRLVAAGASVTKAAEAVGMSRATAYRLVNGAGNGV